MTRVLIVDDSQVVRAALTKALSSDPDLQVVGAARDPQEAWELMDRLRPDVLTLDMEMPKTDGLTFLRRLMSERPIRVVMVSSKVRRSPRFVMEALKAGAMAVVPKPHADYPIEQMLDDLRHTLRTAHTKPLRARSQAAQGPTLEGVPTRAVIAVGASTGGPQAFETFVKGLPPGHPTVVLTQHLAADFIKRFTDRLATLVRSRVLVAQGNEPLLANHILVAPGTHHLRIRREGTGWRTELYDGLPVNFHKPSVDVLMSSVAEAAGRRAAGVLLTGMGNDGAQGLLQMRRAGGFTLAQDRESCVVYGMPRAAVELGAVGEQLALDRLAQRAVELVGGTKPPIG
ncbi:MAG: chemotaxis-specific protein-glutamate methyltransferase CheB [Myxococcales bacterium]|nr:chemotaxis-specific protein-glutamate methyltransferase CheB [Myxococcales bacterium]